MMMTNVPATRRAGEPGLVVPMAGVAPTTAITMKTMIMATITSATMEGRGTETLLHGSSDE